MNKLLIGLFLLSFSSYGQKISDLPAATTLGGTEVVAGVQGSVTKKISVNQISTATQTFLQAAFDAKQATLISGTNIKTINGTSILGSGDFVVSPGSISPDHTWLDVKNYLPEGVTLATSTKQQRVDAWQAAISEAQAGKYGIMFSGSWDLPTDSLIVVDKLAIVGVGTQSALTTTDNHGTVLYINQNTPRAWYNVIFPVRESSILRDFTVQYRGASVPDNTSIGIKIAVDTSVTFEHKMENVTIDSFYVGLRLHNVGSSQFHKNYFRNNRAYGVLISTSESNDLGKLQWTENTWTTVTNPIAGESDTTAHMKIQGGAGMYLINNDMYGYTDYGVWMDMRTGVQPFPAFTGSEYMFQFNRIAFVKYHAFLIDTKYGKSGSGPGIVQGNRIAGLQIQNNYCTANGLVQTVGGTNSIAYVQIQNNMVLYPYNSYIASPPTGIVPIVINGNAIRDLQISDNQITATIFGATGSYVATKPISLTGSISGALFASGNSYAGFPSVSDIADALVDYQFRRDQLSISAATVTAMQVTNANTTNGVSAYTFSSDGTAANRTGGLQYNNSTGAQNIFAASYLNYPFYFGTNNVIRMTIGAGVYAGNVGIGTTTPTARLSLPASTTAVAPLNIPTGTAPTSPNNGDIWVEGSDIKIRLGGTTYTLTKTP